MAPARAADEHDDFEPGDVRPSWISLRDRPAELVTLKERDGWLTLRARGGSLDEPDVILLGRRQQHLAFRARTLVAPAEGRGGLAVFLDERHHYSVEAGPEGRIQVITRIGSLRSVAAELTLPVAPLVLTVRTGPAPEPQDSRSGPDSLVFGVETADGTETELASLDGRYLSTEVAGGFTGRVIGLYTAAGTVHFDWFEYTPVSGEAAR
ncbi:hypothetical protein [Streptomyces sp. D2-8]|uniref:beta-xylosidase family glycoside hydrolase n=1 Tax=Streptomyces sp. D2-8 TaxID=2707767 RepID=UPI0020BD77E6|nr:hypothetical protein [Streptomyces sp. D2-8]